LRSFTEEPASFVRYSPLETEDGSRKLEPASVRSTSEGALVVHFKGVADRDAAVRLRGLRLFIPRTRLPALDEDTYYHADLIGLSALGPDDAPVGTVCAVHNFGAGDLLEIAPVSGGPSLMVPFTKEAVPLVDLSGRRLRMAMTGAPAGPLPAKNACE
jgi:16S rRNA processing protein RimM